jgi:hypothetical protein
MVFFPPLDAQHMQTRGTQSLSLQKVCQKIGDTHLTLNPVNPNLTLNPKPYGHVDSHGKTMLHEKQLNLIHIQQTAHVNLQYLSPP